MKIVYLGRSGRRTNTPPSGQDDVLELLENNWDDFGRKTYFQTVCRIGGEAVELGALRLLIEDVATTAAKLNELRASGWDGVFPIPELNYISVPNEIEFYEQLLSRLGEVGAATAANELRDASFMTRIADDANAARLVRSDSFRASLQRERGSEKAFLDGWRLFDAARITIESTTFRFRNAAGGHSAVRLNFDADSPLPHDINVLIGPNGVGKSQLLRAIVEAWLNPRDVPAGLGFEATPNIGQLVVVSYSPLENFRVDTLGTHLADRSVYKYFGFRGRPERNGSQEVDPLDPPPLPEPVFDTLYPRINAAHSLIDALADDQRYGAITDWPGKLATLYDVLHTALDFDEVALTVSWTAGEEAPDADIAASSFTDGERTFLPIGPRDVRVHSVEALRAVVQPKEGVTFFKNAKRLHLSSGQRLFSYVVINVLGTIRRNSLILVDEPELFLHPTLEIQFIEMLKGILASLRSKALLATHSEVIVRETPADCVHVLQRTDVGIAVTSPPFQTFAGDIQRISSYVFDDRAAIKPYETWIQKQLEAYGGADALLEALGDQVNEELVIRIRAASRQA